MSLCFCLENVELASCISLLQELPAVEWGGGQGGCRPEPLGTHLHKRLCAGQGDAHTHLWPQLWALGEIASLRFPSSENRHLECLLDGGGLSWSFLLQARKSVGSPLQAFNQK